MSQRTNAWSFTPCAKRQGCVILLAQIDSRVERRVNLAKRGVHDCQQVQTREPARQRLELILLRRVVNVEPVGSKYRYLKADLTSLGIAKSLEGVHSACDVHHGVWS